MVLVTSYDYSYVGFLQLTYSVFGGPTLYQHPSQADVISYSAAISACEE